MPMYFHIHVHEPYLQGRRFARKMMYFIGVCVCVCVCVLVLVNMCASMFSITCAAKRDCSCVHACACGCMHVCVWLHACVCVGVRLHACVCSCVPSRVAQRRVFSLGLGLLLGPSL